MPSDPFDVVQIPTDSGPARALLSGFEALAPAGLLVLGPGASGQIATPDLHAVRDAAVADGWAVALVEPPYRVAGRRVPPRGEGPDRAFTTVVADLRGRLPEGTVLVTGGRSFGSRVACRTAAATGAVAVLCLAFPLHPPNNPERTRAGELEPVPVPVLVVQGERDPFGRPGPRPGREVVLVPGDHGLTKDLPGVVAPVRGFLRRWAGRCSSPHPAAMAEVAPDHEDSLLARLRQIALSFPGAKEKVSHGSPTWFTTKVFASWGAHVKGDHHSPALARAVCVLPGADERLALLEDPRFHVPGYIGHRGWLAFDLSTGQVDWDEVAELLDSSFRNTAGVRLIRELDSR